MKLLQTLLVRRGRVVAFGQFDQWQATQVNILGERSA
jgi:hypothetical protein